MIWVARRQRPKLQMARLMGPNEEPTELFGVNRPMVLLIELVDVRGENLVAPSTRPLDLAGQIVNPTRKALQVRVMIDRRDSRPKGRLLRRRDTGWCSRRSNRRLRCGPQGPGGDRWT
jgi:hypothetical protein